MKTLISARIDKGEIKRMDKVVRSEYPKIRNHSEIIRAALKDWLDNYEQKEAGVKP